jgi:hypothetical protein
MERDTMKKLVCAVLALGLLAVATESGHAQTGRYGTFTWNYSLPTGDTKDFTDNDSWLGLSLEGHQLLSERSSLGLVFGWNEFYHDTRDLIEIENGAVSGDQYRHLNTFPMLADLRLYFGQTGASRPYLGCGVGAYYIRQFMDLGPYTLEADAWHFGIAPEFGVQIPSRKGTGAMTAINLRFHMPMDEGNYLGNQAQSFTYWSISLGASWVIGWEY